MSDSSRPPIERPLHQPQFRQDRRIGPNNPFITFTKAEIEQSIPERFEQQVAQYPDQLAVKTRDYMLTYDTLNKTANQIAHAVLIQCRQREKPIALLWENDAPMIAAIFGC